MMQVTPVHIYSADPHPVPRPQTTTNEKLSIIYLLQSIINFLLHYTSFANQLSGIVAICLAMKHTLAQTEAI